ncbi:MAG: AAA family ATPase, partial [Candidatus Helarchaeota archaeon]
MVTILITGISGVGKSTLAEKISAKLNYNHIKTSSIILKIAKEKFGVSSVDKIKNLDHSQLNQVHQ